MTRTRPFNICFLITHELHIPPETGWKVQICLLMCKPLEDIGENILDAISNAVIRMGHRKMRDSSDEETPRLWLDAVRALRGQERGRKLLQRIKDLIRGRRLPFRTATRLQDQLEEEEKSEKSEVDSSGVANKDRMLCR
ncbi:hypothetical protein DUI87_28527 [Hirundo rustica rustica]|uniref:Uncharacterized protein n=1 Tax=Hirundo rustica rustica TaxID=333673 RepID=A0A3M0J269_HIRRU|nr:hypothetical protein DUI87_28527 [Hirundo rustica rustica]